MITVAGIFISAPHDGQILRGRALALPWRSWHFCDITDVRPTAAFGGKADIGQRLPNNRDMSTRPL
jgi:hypothetical protein